MTNEQKAAMLEEIADLYIRIGDKDVALLRECAEMMRERGKAQWMKVAGSATRHFALYRGWVLEVETNLGRWEWSADAAKDFFEDNWAPTLEAAQSAAVAWVDEQEGRDA
jgi:hypothetical protein